MGNRKNIRPNKVKNWGFNTDNMAKTSNLGQDRKKVDRNLANYITPVQLQRLRTDVSQWRDAVAEAERAYYPFRVKMQRIFIDTILNGHVFSLMERRKDLTLLRKFCICDKNDKPVDELTKYFQDSPWFFDFLGYALDARFFGYSLISLGDIVQNELKDVSIIPRWFISPDRHEVGSYIYSTSGADFREQPYSDWHIYVKTKSDSGVSPCGYGIMYQIALYEIFLRNTLGYNGDFVELFAMPYRVGKTTKTDEAERAELERAVRDMGSAGYAIVDPMDEIEFLSASTGTGKGFESYDNLEQRCEAKVSKIILGHEDAMKSSGGKLTKDDEESPQQQALKDKQVQDGRFLEPVINNELIPRLRNLGVINIPEGFRFKFLNDGEEEKIRERQDQSNLVTADIALKMKNAGLKMDAKYFEDRTGIKTVEIEEAEIEEEEEQEQPKVGVKDEDDLRTNRQVKNRLIELYK